MFMGRFYKASQMIRKMDLSSKAITVYDYLCMCVNKSNECFPNKRTIAAYCGRISVASVTRALRELESAGMVRTVFRFDKKHGGRQTSNVYHIYETPQPAEPKEPADIVHEQSTPEVQDNEPEAAPTVAASTCEEITAESQQDTIASVQAESSPATLDNLQPCFLIALLQNIWFVTGMILSPHFLFRVFDTPPHVNMIPLRTRTRKKISLRKRIIFSKVTKWYLLQKHKKDASLGISPANSFPSSL